MFQVPWFKVQGSVLWTPSSCNNSKGLGFRVKGSGFRVRI